MQEKETKGISFIELWDAVKKNIIFLILIMFVCSAIGFTYALVFKRTTYTVSTTAVVQVDAIEGVTNPTEQTKYSYSVYLAKQCKAILKNKNMAKRAQLEGIKINVGALNVEYEDEHFNIEITYQISGKGEEPKKQLVDSLNDYLDYCVAYVNNVDNENNIWKTLAGRIYVEDAMAQNVSTNTGKTTTILISIIIGLVLSVLFVLLAYITNDSVKTKEDVEEITGSFVIASVSLSANFEKKGEQENV